MHLFQKKPVFIFVLLFCLVAARVGAQQKPVTLSSQMLTVDQAINELQAQTGLIVGVNHVNFDISRTVDFHSKNPTPDDILQSIIKGTGHTYITRGKHIIIVRSLPTAPRAAASTSHEPKMQEFEMHNGTITLRDNVTWDQTPKIREYTTIDFKDSLGCYSFCVGATGKDNHIIVKNLHVAQEVDEVNITFNVFTESKAIRTNQAILITPYFVSGDIFHELPSLYMAGKKHRLSRERQSLNKNNHTTTIPDDAILLHNNSNTTYEYKLPDSLFVLGTTLSFESSYTECRKCGKETRTVATDFVVLHRDVTIPPPSPVLSVGDRIAMDYPFVEHDPGVLPSSFDRTNALTVYFHLDRYDLRFDYRDNNRKLSQMIAAINIINQSGSSEITRVVLSGFASPEGPLKRNELLGDERVKAVRDFLAAETGLGGDRFVLFNGASDWEGLRLLVESSGQSWKQDVIDIIETYPEASRMQTIKKLYGGKPYKYMLDHVLPELRSSSYIKVYYKNK